MPEVSVPFLTMPQMVGGPKLFSDRFWKNLVSLSVDRTSQTWKNIESDGATHGLRHARIRVLAGPCPHNGKSLISLDFDLRRAPRLLNACVGGSQFRLGSNKLSAGGTMPAQWKILDFLLFRLVTGSQASQCVCGRIPISACLDKLSTGGTMPAQKKT